MNLANVDEDEALRNWGLTLSLLPTLIYLSAMLVESMTSRAEILREA